MIVIRRNFTSWWRNSIWANQEWSRRNSQWRFQDKITQIISLLVTNCFCWWQVLYEGHHISVIFTNIQKIIHIWYVTYLKNCHHHEFIKITAVNCNLIKVSNELITTNKLWKIGHSVVLYGWDDSKFELAPWMFKLALKLFNWHWNCSTGIEIVQLALK